MNILFEFFDKEPLENVVTCLKYRFDKVVFFGFDSEMDEYEKNTLEKNLMTLCNVKEVVFKALSERLYDKLLSEISIVVMQEQKKGAKCFFDITGGNEAILTALGQFVSGNDISIHKIDINNDTIIYYNKGEYMLEQNVPKQNLKLNINNFLLLYNGKINNKMQRDFKYTLSAYEQQMIESIWNISSPNMKKWNAFSSILKACKTDNHFDLSEYLKYRDIQLHGCAPSPCSKKDFDDYLIKLCQSKVIKNLRRTNIDISFNYATDNMRSILFDAGSILEIYCFNKYLKSNKYDDCAIGVNIVWENDEKNVVKNEIDIILLKGYLPTFISCKNGDVSPKDLYELDTICDRFGGKYSKKELITGMKLPEHIKMRAEEMNIVVTSVEK